MFKKIFLALLLSLVVASQAHAQKGSTIGGGAGSTGITYLVDSYGAIGDSAQGSAASITSGTATVSGGSTNCANADVGKAFLMPGAGAGGAALETTVASCSGSSYVLAANATFSVSPSVFWVGYSGVQVQADGTGCAPGDVITLTGGTAVSQGQLTVNTCQVHGAAVNAAGSGGTTGGCVLTDAGTFTGRPFQIYATIVAGSISALGNFLPLVGQGDYSVNPSSLSAEPVSGCGLSGSPTLTITMGVSQSHKPGSGVSVSAPGSYTAMAASPVAAGSSTGSESGETFNIYFPEGGIYTYGHNNQTAIQAALSAATTNGGGFAQITCGRQYLVSGGNLNVGNQGSLAAVTLQGCTNLSQGGPAANESVAGAAGIFFDPSGGNKINVFNPSSLQNLVVLNALPSYAGATDTFRAAADRVASYSGTLVHFGNPNGGRGGSILNKNDFIGGFALGQESTNNANWLDTNVVFDTTNGFFTNAIPDFSDLNYIYCHSALQTSSELASNTVTAVATNGGLTEYTTTNPHQFQSGDRVVFGSMGSYPNQAVVSYPAGNGTTVVASVQDSTHFTTVQAFNGAQTYTSGGNVNWYPTRQGMCGYYNGTAAGNDGMDVGNLRVNGWLIGLYSWGGQGQHITAPEMNGTFQDQNSVGLLLDGNISSSEVIGSEIQQVAYPVVNMTYGVSSYGIRFVGGQYLSNGMGYAIDNLGTQALNFIGFISNHAVSGFSAERNQYVNLGDSSGPLVFSGGSDITDLAFYAQSYTDWSTLTISPETLTGGSLTAIGGAVLPPAPLNTNVTGTNSANNPLGACDVWQGPALCFGVRREFSSYAGALLNAERASDSATMDIQQDAFGNLNQAQCAAFQGSSTLSVAKWYDQEGSGINAVNATLAQQPALSCTNPKLNGKPGILYANGVADFLTVPTSAVWQGWSSGASAGTILISMLPTGNGVNNDRIFQITPGGGTNTMLFTLGNGGTIPTLGPGYSTTAGVFPTSAGMGSTTLSVVDIVYQWTLTTNVPTISFNGTAQTLGTTTTPVGTAGSDTGQTFTIGGNGTTTTTLPGYIETFIIGKAGPGATQLEQARKADGAYYGTTINFLLKRDIDPASNDNTPVWLNKAA